MLTAEFAGMQLCREGLRIGLLTGRGVTTVTLDLDRSGRRALSAVVALHGHDRDCPGGVDVHTGLLLSTVAALDGGRPRLVVRPGADQPVVLELGRRHAEIPLGTLDACCLLCSGCVEVAVQLGR